MKKLIALIGAVATAFGLYATDLTKSAVSFELNEPGCSGETLNLAEDTMWSTDYDDVFKFGAVADEATFAGAYTGTTRRNDEFDGKTENVKFLKLSTGTNSLQRLFAAKVEDAETAVSTDPIFMDQLVKFTGYEDTQTVFAAGTKVAVWMSEFVIGEENDVEITQTNLYVAVGQVAAGNVTVKNVKIDGEYKLDTWYRLTIRSIGNIIGKDSAEPNALSGFAIYINGNPITIIAEDRDLIDIAGDLIPKAKVLYDKGQLFPSMVAGSTTLKSVGFEGMGGIDDMIVDNVGPAFAQEANFTVTAPEGAAVTRVYNVDDEADLVADANGVYTVVPGTNIKIWLTADNSGDSKWVLKPDPTIVDKTVAATDKDIDLSDEVTPESAVVQVVIGDEDAKYFSELGDAFAFIDGTNATVSVEMLDEGAYWITEGVGYAFFKGTTIDINPVEEEEVLDGVWNLYVDNAAEDEEKEISATDTFGVMPEKVINVTFNEGGFLKLAGNIYGYGRKDAEINVDGATTLVGALTIGAAAYQDATGVGGAVLVTDTLTLDGNKITLKGKGKVKVKTPLTVANAFTNAEKDIKVTEPTDDDYYTYTLKGGVEFTITTPANATITNVEGAELVSGSTYTANDGATVTVTLKADEGYLFANETDTTTETFTAADGETFAPTAPTKAAAKKGLKFFITLNEAINAEGDDDVVVLDNLTLTAPVTATKGFVLDLNGKTVTGNWTTSWANPGAGRDYIFELGANTAVVSNGTVASTANNIGGFHTVGGSLTFGDNTLVDTAWRAVGVYNGATLNVGADAELKTAGEDPTIMIIANGTECTVDVAGKVSNTFAGPRTCANLDAVIMGSGNDKTVGVALTIADGAEITGTACAGIYFPCAGELEIGAASITGTEGVYVKGGASTVIDGAEITATGAKGDYTPFHNGHVWTGDAFVVDVSVGYPEVATQTVSGGTFTSLHGAAIASYKEEGATADRVTGFVTGGKFKGAVEPEKDLIAVGPGQIAKWTTDEDGYLVPDYDTIMIAKNLTTDKQYAWGEFATAISEAADGETIQLIADSEFEFDGEGVRVAGKAITLDLNGKKLSGTAHMPAAIKEQRMIFVASDGDLTVLDSTVAEGGYGAGELHFEYINSGSPKYSAGYYLILNTGKFTLKSGKLTARDYADHTWDEGDLVYAVENRSNGSSAELVIEGGYISVPDHNGQCAVRLYAYDSAEPKYVNKATITGGILDNVYPFCMTIPHQGAKFDVNISGGTFNGYCRLTGDKYGYSKINITGGTFNGNVEGFDIQDPLYDAEYKPTRENLPFLFISGGTFEQYSYLQGTATSGGNVIAVRGPTKDNTLIVGGTFNKLGKAEENPQNIEELLTPSIPVFAEKVAAADADHFSVAKVPADLEIVPATGVASVTYTVNGEPSVDNQTVVYGDVVKITGITYAEGYGEGTVKEGAEYEMDAATMTAAISGGTSVQIDVDAQLKTFTVTFADVENGTVETSVTNATMGTEVTIIATPAEGYAVDTIAVTNVETEAEVTVTGDKFTMPAANVKVYATFKETSTEPIPPLVNPTQADIEKVFEKAADPTLATKVTPDNYAAFRDWSRTIGDDPVAGEAAVLASPKAFVSFELSPIVNSPTLFTNDPAVKFTAIAQNGTSWNATMELKDGDVAVQLAEAKDAYANFVKVGSEVTAITQQATITAAVKESVEGSKKIVLTITPPTGDAGFIKFTTAKSK